MRKKHTILVKLGETIRLLRKRRHLSQEDLALEANLDRTYVGGIERGERNIAVINLCKLAKTLEVPPGRLLRGIEHSETSE